MKIRDLDDYIEVQMNRNNFSLFNVENLCKYSLLLFLSFISYLRSNLYNITNTRCYELCRFILI